MRKLGALACGQLQGKKASDVEIIASSEFTPSALGTFWNSFYLSNYEYSTKTPPPEDDDKDKEPEEVEDERTKKWDKKIASFDL